MIEDRDADELVWLCQSCARALQVLWFHNLDSATDCHLCGHGELRMAPMWPENPKLNPTDRAGRRLLARRQRKIAR